MKACPADTYANSRSWDYRLLNRELFAYSPGELDGNTIRDIRWWNTGLFFSRMYRETAGNFRFSVKPKMK